VQPLIPRYFDLLVFLVERRGEAVHRRDIFDRIWNDVILSDSALSHAIRTIRPVLETILGEFGRRRAKSFSPDRSLGQNARRGVA
jgi:DNA-binding winged helix-turn-helix (wHTH) protein